jgi:hypothetical protein
MNKWFVSRQSYWPDGTNVVEIASGGLDYANPDMLVANWKRLGEGETFNDPREAVEAAIAICREWRKQKVKCSIAHGYTAGYTMPFEEGTFKEAIAWADKEWESLPKCDCGCDEPLGNEYWYANEWDGLKYATEYCAEKQVEFEMQQEALENERDEDGE